VFYPTLYHHDIFCYVDGTNNVLIHRLSQGQSQSPFLRTKGVVQQACFHPSKPFFFVATQQFIRVYNLTKRRLVQKLRTGVRLISSLDIHPQGDNLIMGSHDRHVCWFDMDLSIRPYKVLK
jgi:ribosome biogenesis protein ERB1